MNIRNEYQAPLARLIDQSYTTDFNAIEAFDPTLDATFKTAWEAEMVVVEGLIFPEAITRLMTDQKDIKHAKMAACSPLITVLTVRIKSGIASGTITQTLASFMLDKLNASINNLNITQFNIAFTNTNTQIVKNTTALNTLGFTAAMQAKLVSYHKDATLAQIAYDKLKISRKNLSPANLLSIKQLYASTSKICSAGVGNFSMPLDKDKVTQYTIAQAIKSVRPTPPKEIRERHIGATKSICLKTNPIKKDTLQLTLLTDTEQPVYYCMQDLKTGICTTGGILKYNEQTNIKQGEIPGTGIHLIITNQNLVNIIVSTFTIKG